MEQGILMGSQAGDGADLDECAGRQRRLKMALGRALLLIAAVGLVAAVVQGWFIEP